MSDLPTDKKNDKHKQTIMVIVGVLGLALTYLLYKNSSGNSAAAATPVTSGGGVAGGGGPGFNMAKLLNRIGGEIGADTKELRHLSRENEHFREELRRLREWELKRMHHHHKHVHHVTHHHKKGGGTLTEHGKGRAPHHSHNHPTHHHHHKG